MCQITKTKNLPLITITWPWEYRGGWGGFSHHSSQVVTIKHSSVTFDLHLCMEAISCSDKLSSSHSHIPEVGPSTMHDEERDLHLLSRTSILWNSPQDSPTGRVQLASLALSKHRQATVINKLHVLTTVTMYQTQAYRLMKCCHLSHVL